MRGMHNRKLTSGCGLCCHSFCLCVCLSLQGMPPHGRLAARRSSARSCAVPRRAGFCGAPLPLLPPSSSCPSCSRRERVACRTLTCRDSSRQQRGALREAISKVHRLCRRTCLPHWQMALRLLQASPSSAGRWRWWPQCLQWNETGRGRARVGRRASRASYKRHA